MDSSADFLDIITSLIMRGLLFAAVPIAEIFFYEPERYFVASLIASFLISLLSIILAAAGVAYHCTTGTFVQWPVEARGVEARFVWIVHGVVFGGWFCLFAYHAFSGGF